MSVNSSNSDFQLPNRQQQFVPSQNFKPKKIKDYLCPCGRSYGSYPALYSHIKRKHDGNPPGEVVKPKPARRRGRPFKFEPINLKSQNSHKNASRHLEQYLRNIQYDQQNQFPLKDFANQQPSKLNFVYPENDEEQYLRYQHMMKKSRQNEKMWSKDDERQEQINMGQRQQNIPFINEQFHNDNQYSFVGNQNHYGTESLNFNQKRFPINQVPNFHQIKNHQDPRMLRNPNIGMVNGGGNNEFRQFFRMREQQKRRRIQYEQQRYDVFESIYSKPYELELKQEMEDKFSPIAQGMSQFLQPILKQLLERQQRQMMRQKVINLDDGEIQGVEKFNDKEANEGMNQNERRNQQNMQNMEKNQINLNTNDNKQRSQVKNTANQQKTQVQCRELLQNQHLKDIVRWMMSPPQQLSGPLSKENYIQNSFRCCLVQFLDFSNQFLQKVQYEQILLVLVFFCDHILAATGSFQNRPQPLVYEMFMFFNSFLSQYLPKLIAYMPALNRLFIFVQHKKKISELFMWISTWQSIQQYYHNRYFRERIVHELQQENLKSLQYQQKYNMYINQAQKQNVFSQTINNTYPLHQHLHFIQPQQQQQQIVLPEQKVEQNPQPILFNPNINNVVNDQNNNGIVFDGNYGNQNLVNYDGVDQVDPIADENYKIADDLQQQQQGVVVQCQQSVHEVQQQQQVQQNQQSPIITNSNDHQQDNNIQDNNINPNEQPKPQTIQIPSNTNQQQNHELKGQ